MKKSTLVTKFLRYWNARMTLQQAETEVLLCFTAEFPVSNYADWNTHVDEDWCEHFFQLYKDDGEIDLLWLVVGLCAVGPQPTHA